VRIIANCFLTELTIGRVLGRGGFCVVNQISKIHLGIETNESIRKSDDEHYIHNIVQDRTFMAEHCIRQGKDCRYAIKRVQESSHKDPQTYVNAVVDLAVEARFLAVVRHPNIIKMRSMEGMDPYHPKFFIILDRLFDIMPMRLKKWKSKKGGRMKKMFDLKGKKAEAFFVERLSVAYDIACALSYLHGMSVIYRDLKPDNIGFDVRGDVKIFDFGLGKSFFLLSGIPPISRCKKQSLICILSPVFVSILAKEIQPSKRLDDGTYNLTGDTGSLRYMAPGM
jgi:serine/threonine protein kinase